MGDSSHGGRTNSSSKYQSDADSPSFNTQQPRAGGPLSKGMLAVKLLYIVGASDATDAQCGVGDEED